MGARGRHLGARRRRARLAAGGARGEFAQPEAVAPLEVVVPPDAEFAPMDVMEFAQTEAVALPDVVEFAQPQAVAQPEAVAHPEAEFAPMEAVAQPEAVAHPEAVTPTEVEFAPMEAVAQPEVGVRAGYINVRAMTATNNNNARARSRRRPLRLPQGGDGSEARWIIAAPQPASAALHPPCSTCGYPNRAGNASPRCWRWRRCPELARFVQYAVSSACRGRSAGAGSPHRDGRMGRG